MVDVQLRSRHIAILACSLCLISIPTGVWADASDAGTDAGSVVADAASDAPASPADPRVRELSARAQRIRAFIDGSLDVTRDPRALFEIPSDDEAAIRVEVERLRAIVEQAEVDAGVDAGKKKTKVAAAAKLEDAGGGDASVLARLDPELWEAQLELDRARLAYYSLGKVRRTELFKLHADRQKKAAETGDEVALTEAEKKSLDAESEKQRALEDAKRARTEAARLVAEEHARLLDVKKKQADFEVELVKRERALGEAHEKFLGLERRVRELLDKPSSDPLAADALYDEVRAELRIARADLALATTDLTGGDSSVPGPGEDRLVAIPAEVDRSATDKSRRDVEGIAATLTERENELRKDRAAKLYERVTLLNADRLNLLPRLSSDKRSAITGFGPTGVDQAAAELRQVVVVLHYHVALTLRWIARLSTSGARGQSALAVGFLVLRWFAPLFVFIWWRRRADRTLAGLREALKGGDGKTRPRGAPPTPAERFVNYVSRIHKPLEWLLLLWAVLWLVPVEAKSLLEVQLVSTIFGWTFGGAVVVQTIDTLAGGDSERRIRRSRLLTSHIRLRSLKLMGRVVVVFALILALSNHLVGEGTIYVWVFSVCWLSAVPVALVLVKWWREVIFERVALKRRKNAVDEWIGNNSEGWKSYPAAFAGGAILLGEGAYRAARSWVGRFDITRRVLAYLFRREISKKSDAASTETFGPLDRASVEKLGPETASSQLVPSVADSQVDEIIKRIHLPGGGVFAVVGERGAGKTTVLERIVKEAPDVARVQCPFGGMEAFAPALLKSVEAGKDASLESVAAELDKEDRDVGILIDDAHRLIQPMMGGVRAFDRVLAIARSHSANVSWVFAFDEVIWRFFERMRGSRPAFDDVIRLKPWGEDAIVRLLTERSKEAGVSPSFSHLQGQLGADADEIDEEDAAERTAASYYRLLWDHSAGNPGVALHAWRSSLGIDEEGAVAVRAFSAPRIDELEGLPDNAVFVLRGVVQLERAEPEDLARATGIVIHEVEDALRFGLVRGYFRRSADGYRVTWRWFRTVTRFLQRRHLLFSAR